MSTSSEMERGLIGSLLRNPEGIYEAQAAGVTASSFGDVAHYRWFAALESLVAAGAPVTAETVADQSGADVGELREVKADGALSGAAFYARRVMEHAARRALAARLRKAELALEHFPPEEVLSELLDDVSGIVSASEARPIGAYVEAAWREIDPETRGMNRIPTGFTLLDKALGGGVRHDDTVTIGADTGGGKSTLAWQIADHLGGLGMAPLFLSFEMSAESLAVKALASRAGLNPFMPRYGAHEWALWKKARSEAAESPVVVSRCVPTVDAVTGEIRRHTRTHGPQPVFVDYLQLVTSKSSTVREAVKEVSARLRSLCLETGAPFFQVAQLNRSGTKGRQEHGPGKHDFAESSQIENDSTVVMLLHRPNEDEATVYLKVAKQRFAVSGRPPKIEYEWHESGQRLTEVGWAGARDD